MRFAQRLAPPLALFLLAPLAAEFLLGDLTIAQLGALPILACMYGGGALLIREAVRRSGGGWRAFIALALAYGLLEEGIADQSLFNPDFLHPHMLAYGFWAQIGAAPPWVVCVLTLHVVWSLATPIGIAETLFSARRRQPWLGAIGLWVTAALFGLGLAATAGFFLPHAAHHASNLQLAVCAALIAGLLAVAFWPRAKAGMSDERSYPAIWIVIVGVLAGSVFVLLYGLGNAWRWPAVAATFAELSLVGLMLLLIWRLGRSAMSEREVWAASSAGVLVYAWHGYLVDRDLHGGGDLVGHSFVVAAFCALQIVTGVRQARRRVNA